MDTRLKDRHRLGYLIIVLIIAGATAAMLALYPYFARQGLDLMANENQMTGLTITYSNDWQVYEYDYSESYYQFYYLVTIMSILLAAAVGACALLLPFSKSLRIQDSRLFHTPFEIVAIAATCVWGMMLSTFPADLVETTINGTLIWEFMESLGFNSEGANALTVGLNAACWASLFALIYWIMTCFRSVFTLGIFQYLKERTLFWRLCRWCKKVILGCYDIISSIDLKDRSNKYLLKIVAGNFVLLTIICCFWFAGIGALIVYSIILFFVLKRCLLDIQKKYAVLLRATNQIGDGNLDVEITENLGVFEPFKGELQKIQYGFKRAVEEEVKSQSMRTELITNVSHDLKTPLTAIITYVNLLKKEDITREERASYIQVLEQKSMRLKSLIEDLFEISKVNSRNITLNLVEVDIVNLMKQVMLELEDQVKASGLDFRFHLPEEKVCLLLDSEKTYRVFENLIVNILKYALSGTRVYINVETGDGYVCVSMKNISASEINVTPEDLTERFVRGDTSRNTEGSGLGLAIVKSFVELQKGKFELEIEADLFKVKIKWPLNLEERETGH